MSGSGRGGSGRGNSRRRPSRRWDSDSRAGDNPRSERPPAHDTVVSPRNDIFQRNETSSKKELFSKSSAGGRPPENPGRQNRAGGRGRGAENSRNERAYYAERPKWTPPKLNTEPLPVPVCPWCGKPIRDMPAAIADKETGEPVHFDCVAARIAAGENLEKDETLSYIGGGRFGVVSFGSRGAGFRASQGKTGTSADGPNQRFGQEAERRAAASSAPACVFRIKKIIEWEDNDERAEWRSVVCEHYSVI